MAEIEKTEKITVNLGLIDIGEIDLLVGEGFYANRTDFIRSAIHRQLETRSTAVRDTVARRTLELGSVHYTRADLEQRTRTRRPAARQPGPCLTRPASWPGWVSLHLSRSISRVGSTISDAAPVTRVG